ncbi:YcfL family protein [Shewanella sp. WXL01]|uniref:DUF1425 domain-containing protein n=1 Tax=Shewanella maritima TaxID=2520507 RepID=A0A411PDS9_9GAMM|nr:MULTISPECIES: YcfL family protein [Shewanella]NKF50468.1 YcfL family protein [Shewanella sp. WXL01]QBF81530.1 DUF1425 domain-containing protein [Shewanella maritima]
MKLLKSALIALGLVGSAVMFAGCANHTSGLSASSDGNVRVDNATFNREVAIGNLRSKMTSNIMEGAAVISSKVATDLRLQYKFTWYDASGFTIEDEATSWKSLKLHGKQQMQVSAVAPNANATRFEVYVRKAFSN